MKYTSVITLGLCFGILAGCGKNESTTGPGTSLTPVTITGKVIGANRQPVPGVPVLISGLTSVNTDANGSFTIANVGRPYTITVIDATNKQAILYRGLTRTDPTLVFLGSTPGIQHTASLSGKIYPAANYPEPATRKTVVGFVAQETGKTTTATGATGVYSLSGIQWYGASTITGSLHALQFDYNTTTGLPTSYIGYGVRSGVSLLDATSNPNGNDTMSVVSTTSMTGTITVPTGYTLGQKGVWLILGNTTGLSLLFDNTSTTSFTYAMPVITDAVFRFGVSATKTATGSVVAYKGNIAGNATNVAVTVPNPPELSLPINAATNVKAGTQFSWSAFTGGVHLVMFSGGSKPSYYILTTATSDSIPDLSAAGLGLPASSAYSWAVYGFGPYADVDAASGADGFLGILSGSINTDATWGLSTTRSFTTAP